MNFPLLSAQEAARLIKDKEVLGIGGFSSGKHSANPVFPPLKVLLSFA